MTSTELARFLLPWKPDALGKGAYWTKRYPRTRLEWLGIDEPRETDVAKSEPHPKAWPAHWVSAMVAQ